MYREWLDYGKYVDPIGDTEKSIIERIDNPARLSDDDIDELISELVSDDWTFDYLWYQALLERYPDDKQRINDYFKTHFWEYLEDDEHFVDVEPMSSGYSPENEIYDLFNCDEFETRNIRHYNRRKQQSSHSESGSARAA